VCFSLFTFFAFQQDGPRFWAAAILTRLENQTGDDAVHPASGRWKMAFVDSQKEETTAEAGIQKMAT